MSAVTSIVWIPRGSSRQKPVRFELTPEDVHKLKVKAKEARDREAEAEADDDEEEAADAAEEMDEDENSADDEDIEDADKKSMDSESELPAELNMGEYDEEEEVDLLEALDNDDDENMDEDTPGLELIPQGDAALLMESNAVDEEDEEDDQILPTDTLMAVALTEDDVSHVEIQVLTSDGSLYTHHDILLPDFPLCMTWLDCPPFLEQDGTQSGIGSYLAVGTFNPAIEIWNLDVLDPIEPSAVLGGEDKTKKSKKTVRYLPDSHTDAVISLSWNTTFRQALASGSADKTCKIWDVTTQRCSLTLTHHTDKVQSVLWHPTEAWLLATGSYDKRVCLTDARDPSNHTVTAARLSSDIEALAFDPFAPHLLYGATEDGVVFAIDLRKYTPSGNSSRSTSNAQSGFVLSFQAHDKTVSSLSFSSGVPGMLATSSLDKSVKVWDVASVQSDRFDAAPTCVAYKSMNVGKLFTARFCSDDAFLYATAGDKGMVAVWESDEMDTIKNHFEPRQLHIHSSYLHGPESEPNPSSASVRQRTVAQTALIGLTIPNEAALERERQDQLVAELDAEMTRNKQAKKQNDKKKDKKKK